ncbi:MAG: SseB family protein [Pseudomonadota bacterium]
MTRLDAAHAALATDPENADARARYLGALGDIEVLLKLLCEPEGESIQPDVIETASGTFALAFDTAERFAGASSGVAPYAALPGRIVAELLAAAGVGLAINMGASTEMIVTSQELAWLGDQLRNDPDETAGRIVEARAPKRLPDALLSALDTQLARAQGLAKVAHLVEVTYDDDRRGHLLAVVEAVSGSEGAFARSIDNALRFSGLDAAELDVAFFGETDPVIARIAKVGLRYDIPQAADPTRPVPGTDPESPPKLR